MAETELRRRVLSAEQCSVQNRAEEQTRGAVRSAGYVSVLIAGLEAGTRSETRAEQSPDCLDV